MIGFVLGAIAGALGVYYWQGRMKGYMQERLRSTGTTDPAGTGTTSHDAPRPGESGGSRSDLVR